MGVVRIVWVNKPMILSTMMANGASVGILRRGRGASWQIPTREGTGQSEEGR